jgi:DNA polymerase V
LLQHRISAGFPSPADDYIENSLDLNMFLVRNKAATFFFPLMGDSMTGANIHDGDILVVDRSIAPTCWPSSITNIPSSASIAMME